MKGPKLLPKKITSKMNKRETTKYEKLVKDWIKTGEDADKAQRASTNYYRALAKIKEPTVAQKKKDQKLIDAGFKAEYTAFKKADEYDDYKKKMTEKYA